LRRDPWHLARLVRRPKANAYYCDKIIDRDVFAAVIDDVSRSLIALDYHFGLTCNIWLLGVMPQFHRRGIGAELIACAEREARLRGCRQLAVETVSPRMNSPEYEITRRFYQRLDFIPFVEFEPAPSDHMMWLMRLI
jgi:GNAT superfamily N-acetyltransferase